MDEEELEVQLDLGTVYDMNKELVEQTQKPLSLSALHDVEKKLRKWCGKNVQEYMMLYCKELNDFTLFRRLNYVQSISLVCEQVIMCLRERGDILSIDFLEDGAVECWVKTDDDIHAFYLFKYDDAVILGDEQWLKEKGYL